MGTGVSGGSLSPSPAQGGVLGSNPSTASASLVALRKSLILLNLGFPARRRAVAHHVGLREGCEKACWPWGTHQDVAVLSHLEKLARLPSSQADLEPANTPVPRAAPGVGTAAARDPLLSSQLDPWPPGWSAAAPLGSSVLVHTMAMETQVPICFPSQVQSPVGLGSDRQDPDKEGTDEGTRPAEAEQREGVSLLGCRGLRGP